MFFILPLVLQKHWTLQKDDIMRQVFNSQQLSLHIPKKKKLKKKSL